MKRSVQSIALSTLLAAAVAVLCTGCDLVRASLGKPTSADLELLRIAERVRTETALKDSLAALEATAPAAPDISTSDDTVSTAEQAAPEVDTDSETEVKPAPVAVDNAAPETGGIKKYYVVVGAFKEEAGIKQYVRDMSSKGYQTVLLPFKSGSTAVCLEGTDDIETARAQKKALRDAGVDSWIYSSNQKLHKAQ